MDRDDLAKICDARDTICDYCGGNNCDECVVTDLINRAFEEVEDDEYNDGDYDEDEDDDFDDEDFDDEDDSDEEDDEDEEDN